MKPSLFILGLLLLLTNSVVAASAQQTSQNLPPGDSAPYAMAPQVPPGTVPYAVAPQVPPGAVPMMQMPPPGYGGPDFSQSYQGQGSAQQQFVQWGPPANGMSQGQPIAQGVPIQGDPTQGVSMQTVSMQAVPLQSVPMQGVPMQGVPPHDYGAPGPDVGMMQAPPRLSAYEQQEAALRESQMMQQLEDAKQQKEMEESFRDGVMAEFDANSKSVAGTTGGFNGDQTKLKSGVQKTKSALKTGMRWCAPTASYIGTFFLLRGMTGGY